MPGRHAGTMVFRYKYSAPLRTKVARFKRLLRKDPHACCPPLNHVGITAARHADYKHTTRAWDIARIELGLVAAEQVTRENSAFYFTPGFTPRVVKFSSHEPARKRAARV
jgi:hypothetical protein